MPWRWPPTGGRRPAGWTPRTTGTSGTAARYAPPSAALGSSAVRPDLGRRHPPRHPGRLPPRPRPAQRAAHVPGRVHDLQPRPDGDVLDARREPGDEPDLRRRLRPVPDSADRADRARVQLDPPAHVADGSD